MLTGVSVDHVSEACVGLDDVWVLHAREHRHLKRVGYGLWGRGGWGSGRREDGSRGWGRGGVRGRGC